VPQAISIHVGLNEVDPAHYQGWSGELVACEFDANDMEKLAKGRGFKTHKLLTKAATAEAVTSALEDASGKLDGGDMLVFTYSGHGGQVPDANGDEQDRMDETWVLYDRQMVDDELYSLLGKLKPGVRVAIFSDSCHSGTVARGAVELIGPDRVAVNGGNGSGQPRVKGMPDEVVRATYDANKEMYDEIQKSLPPFDKANIGASVILTSGCQDNQTSLDGDKNGLFTQTLLKVWDNGEFKSSYRTFWKRIARQMPPWQSPNLFIVGTPDQSFARQTPFTL
jgi:metacaspase-1